MNYSLKILENKLRVLTVPMQGSESLTATVWIKAGSRQENDRISGLAHFLEHMAFKGGKKYKTAKEISEIVDGMGAENNAGTSKEWTNFWIKTQSANLETALDVLSDITLSPILEQKEIDRERGVIYEELAMYEDTPMMSIGEFFEENLFGGSDLGRKIGGDKESLKNVNRGEFMDFREHFYHSENMLVAISGGVNDNLAETLVRKYFSDINEGQSSSFSQGEYAGSRERVSLKNKKSDQAHLMLGFKTEGYGYNGRFAQAVLATILGRGMSSRLFIEVRERRGLAYAVRATQERYSDIGNFAVYGGVTLEKIDEAVKVIADQLYGLASKKHPISPKELTKAKNSLVGRIALSLEDSSEVGDFFAEQILFDKEVVTPKEAFARVNEVTVDEVYAEAVKIFTKGESHLSIIGPYGDKERFAKLI